MKKSLAVLSICCIILFVMAISGRNTQQALSVSQPLTGEQQTVQTNPMYEIKVTNGRLAIYPYGSSRALEVTEIRISTLPKYDQELLAAGYPIYTRTQLAQFLEDYGS